MYRLDERYMKIGWIFLFAYFFCAKVMAVTDSLEVRKNTDSIVVALPLTTISTSDVMKKPQNGLVSDKQAEELFRWNDPVYTQKRPWKALAEATGINVLVHCFDRFVLNEDFAKVGLKDISHNFQHAFVWDNDQFSTNLFAHPYHGNLYFNAARSNGMTFWESAPYALGGSLQWEFLGEVEPPALNDLIATTIGGITIGEITHRISALVLNDKSRGLGRFLREFAATIINPMQGFTRLTNGDAWKVRNSHYLYHDYQRIPVDFTLTAGLRYLADDGGMFRGESTPFVKFYLEYGDIFNDEENRPYDYFTTDATFNFAGNQPLINGLHIMGRLWSVPVYSGKDIETRFGIFQHFNYYDSKPVKDGTSLTPYRISEAASFGPGIIYRFAPAGNLTRFEQRLFVNGILLGGTKSDYYNIINRDYNMGSGYSVKGNLLMDFTRIGRFAVNWDYYRIFTWKGYEGKNLATIDPIYLNSQGDKGNAELLVINPMFVFNLKSGVGVEFSGSYFIRQTRYKYYDDVRAKTFEVRLGMVYNF